MTDKELDYMILQKENENLLKADKDLVREIEEIQSYLTDKVAESEQAVKEFAEKLRKKVISLNGWEFGEIDIIDADDIDEVLKEYEE